MTKVDPYNGKGGAYEIDKKTGERRLVEPPTKPPERPKPPEPAEQQPEPQPTAAPPTARSK